jgi:hypothetical protein
MGAYLSSPITEKISNDKSTENFTYGASSMQGWRKSQEVGTIFHSLSLFHDTACMYVL